jgi:hypothetical protein
MKMRKLLLTAIALGSFVAVAAPADARQGCGPGWHRGYHGHCRPNRGRHVEPRLYIGRYYPGHGYWDGRRYWHHRYRWHGHWRYR